MADVFDEVSEDLRRERALKLWKKFAPLIVAAAVALVLATAGYVFWQDYSRKRTEAEALRFFEAASLAASDMERAKTELRAVARDARGGYGILARLKEAALATTEGGEPAAALYRAIAADTALDVQLRDGAAVLAAMLTVDTAPPADLIRTLQGLRTPSGPWRHSAGEIEALAHLRAGDKVRAADIYRQIADDLAAPAGLRQRASEMLAALEN